MSKRLYHTYMKTGIVLFLGLLFLLAGPFAPSLFSQQEREESEPPIEAPLFFEDTNLYDGRLVLDLAEKIDLTPKQEEKIETLMLEHESFSIKNSAEIKIKELRILSFLTPGNTKVNRKDLERFVREISRIKTDMIVHFANYLLDVRDVLTPQQLQKLKRMEKKKKLPPTERYP